MAAHGLTLWILQVDPARDSGGIPLPGPFSSVASALTLTLDFLGPLLVGCSAALAVGAIRRRRVDGFTVLSAFVALYVAWIMPWVEVVTWD
jgi:hypothetical protein